MLYPKKCPLCHQILKEKDRLICPECSGKVRPISGPRCMKCGRPVKWKRNTVKIAARVPIIYGGQKYFWYGEVWRQSLVRFKYYGCREYGDFYAKAMSVFGKNIWNGGSLI